MVDVFNTKFIRDGISQMGVKSLHFASSDIDNIKIFFKVADSMPSTVFVCSVDDYNLIEKIAKIPKNVVSLLRINASALGDLEKINSHVSALKVSVDYEEKDILLKFIGDNVTNSQIIISPNISINCKTGMSLSQLTELYGDLISVKSNHTKIGVDYGILPSDFIRKHPCNAYVTDPCTCHSKKSNVPRCMVFSDSGDIFPFCSKIDGKYKMGSFSDDGILNEIVRYIGSESHNYFLKTCENIFLEDLIPYPYPIFPWIDYFINHAEG
ncbi:hypothetical protein [Methanolacinia paynteri]|uniref:hypothetical protein n=1 Tax=Methanolacinia paynteri TaxID=230356 RepID=UPI0012F6B705|nr:hypothetical protein [Methanolacinia paynteri]